MNGKPTKLSTILGSSGNFSTPTTPSNSSLYSKPKSTLPSLGHVAENTESFPKLDSVPKRGKSGVSKPERHTKANEKQTSIIPLVDPSMSKSLPQDMRGGLTSNTSEHNPSKSMNFLPFASPASSRATSISALKVDEDDLKQNDQSEGWRDSLFKEKKKTSSVKSPKRSITSSKNRVNGGVIRRRSSHEVMSSPMSSPHVKEAPPPVLERTIHELCVEEESLALANDRIIQDRLQQAKALSRKQDNGTYMHTFSLWSKKAAPVATSQSRLPDSIVASAKEPIRGQWSRDGSGSGLDDYYFETDYMAEAAVVGEEAGRGKRGRGLANVLRETVAGLASKSSEPDTPEESDEVRNRQYDVESLNSIEEEEELLHVNYAATPMRRRRSHTEGELTPFIRLMPSYDDSLAAFAARSRSSPDLSEVSHDSLGENCEVTVTQSHGHFPPTLEQIDFSDSTMKWKQGEFLGEGSFGCVYKGMNEATGELIAVKQLFLSGDSDEEVRSLRKEISVMWDLNHANIVRYLGTARTERCLYILLEYVPGGSISSMLKQFGAFTETLIKRFSSHIIRGTDYLHSKGIIHRDIKGANVLVGVDGIAKLSDFGCSKKVVGVCTTSLEESMKVMQGSVPWMAPEVIKQTGYGFSSDIWSVGATMIEMGTGKPPWVEFSNNLATLFHVATLSEPPPVPTSLSALCRKFISRCLCIHANDRATAAALILDSFLATD